MMYIQKNYIKKFITIWIQTDEKIEWENELKQFIKRHEKEKYKIFFLHSGKENLSKNTKNLILENKNQIKKKV